MTRGPARGVAIAAAFCAVSSSPASSADPAVVDDFEDVTGWTAHPADGVALDIRAGPGFSGNALQLDFRFSGGGYAVARRELALDLPENYAFSFRIRGDALPNHLEFKLIDSTGENVWWSVRRDMDFPREWRRVAIKKRHISFAWGPLGGGEIEHVAAIELAVTAGSGGTGSVWIDELRLVELPPPGAPLPDPVVKASSALSGHDAASALDGNVATGWAPDAGDAERWIALDFGGVREYGGLTVEWAADRNATGYVVEASHDETHWRALRTVSGGNGGRDDLYLPESESRQLRLRIVDAHGDGSPVLTGLAVQPIEWSATREAFFAAIAKDAPRGSYPRGISGEQSYWTVVGLDGDSRECLFNEDGMTGTGKERFSIEPFVFWNDRLVTWADVQGEQSLEAGFLPMPRVTWRYDDLQLTISAVAVGEPGGSSVVVRYAVRNDGTDPTAGSLYLALRPFQTNPPSQDLNTIGGTARVHEITREGDSIYVDGDRAVNCVTRPDSFGAVSFDGGDIVVDHLGHGTVGAAASVRDPFGAASAALAYAVELAAGAERTVEIVFPLHPGAPVPRGDLVAARERSRSAWESRLGRVAFELPPIAREFEETLKAQLGWVLVNRSGPAIQPGSRAYARSWIRDGSLTSSALLRMGHSDVVLEFLEWFAPYQYDDGKVPCVVDWRGADPVPEHDSNGEFIFLVAEYYRYTDDHDVLARMWPRVVAAAGYLDSLRQRRRTAAFEDPDRQEFYGILPPSISHEGYSAKPMHSYWDDFFALRGFKDAAFLAGELGHEGERARLEVIRDEFERDLVASIGHAMERHRIDYIPGCADLGDFDATSTTVGLSPAHAGGVLPRGAVTATFERYWQFFDDRRGGEPWDAFTPYETRNIGAFVRLGWRDRANELVDFFLEHRRPPGWRQWPEVVSSQLRTPRFLGDLPHSWVGTDFVRSALDLFAYEREDGALVVAAGLPFDWLSEGPVGIRGLRTRYGPITFSARLDGEATIVEMEGALRMPASGIVVRPPTGGEALVTKLPAVVVIRP
jgi:hypothetical protein